MNEINISLTAFHEIFISLLFDFKPELCPPELEGDNSVVFVYYVNDYNISVIFYTLY